MELDCSKMCNECFFFFSTMKHDLNYPESSLFRKTEGDSTRRVDLPPLFHPVIAVQSLLPRSGGWGGGLLYKTDRGAGCTWGQKAVLVPRRLLTFKLSTVVLSCSYCSTF